MNFNTNIQSNIPKQEIKNPADALKESRGPINLNPKPAPAVYTQKPSLNLKPAHLKNTSRTGVEIYRGNGMNMNAAVNGQLNSQGSPVYDNSNKIPIRRALNDLGYSNDVIGYDGADVLLGGQKFMTPDENVDGTTYTNSGAFIDAVNKTRLGDDIVAVSDYASKKGMLNNIRYEPDGTAFYGGFKIGNTVQFGDTVYATQSEIDKAIEASNAASGYKSNKEMIEDAYAPTDDKSKAFSDRVNSFTEKPFVYNPEEDATYQNVRDEYVRLAQKAREDAYAREAMLNGGYGGSDASTAGDLAYAEMMSQLLLQMPQYADRAENSYENLYKKNIEAENRYESEHARNMMRNYNAPAADNELARQAMAGDRERIDNDRKFALDEAAVNADINNIYWNQGFQEKQLANEERYYNDITKPQATLQNISILTDLINNTQDAKGNKLPSYWFLMNDDTLAQWFANNAGVYVSPEWIRAQKQGIVNDNQQIVKKIEDGPKPTGYISNVPAISTQTGPNGMTQQEIDARRSAGEAFTMTHGKGYPIYENSAVNTTVTPSGTQYSKDLEDAMKAAGV